MSIIVQSEILQDTRTVRVRLVTLQERNEICGDFQICFKLEANQNK